jgi:hypothetical protein
MVPKLNMIVELGPLEREAARPVFQARAGDLQFLVELDSSALQKLAFGRGAGDDWRAAIKAQRGRVRVAAQALFEEGFLSDEPVPRLFVTALDLV